MISLSKLFHSNNKSPAKVIQIKAFDVIKNDQKQSTLTQNTNEEYVDIKQQIEQAKKELLQLKEEKAQLLKQTEAEINKAKEQWNQEKQTYIKQAKDEGYTKGFSFGKEESMKQYEHLILEANDIIRAATKNYDELIKQSDHMIIDLAISVAEKIIHQKLHDNKDVFSQLVEDVIEDLTNQEHIYIHIHSSHYEYMQQRKNELEQLIDENTKLSILVDPDATDDSCLIEYSTGKIDASVDTQLKQIKTVLHEIVTGNNE